MKQALAAGVTIHCDVINVKVINAPQAKPAVAEVFDELTPCNDDVFLASSFFNMLYTFYMQMLRKSMIPNKIDFLLNAFCINFVIAKLCCGFLYNLF